MIPWRTLLAVWLTILSSGVLLAQDPLKVDSGHYKVVLENASVRVLRVSYAPGAKSVMHQHPDAIVVALSPSKVRFTLADGKTQDSDMASESAMYTPAGTHTPANIGTAPVDAVLVEFKAAAPGKAALPSSRPGLALKTLAEGARAAAYRETVAPGFVEPAGSKHDFEQVVIALGPASMSMSVDGKPAKTTWARGDVVFIGRGAAHEARNASAQAAELVIVAIK